jgi:hypothetical protein
MDHGYQAPTWSWASVNDEVKFMIHSWASDRQPLANIVSVSISLSDPRNLFGQVTSAKITVSGTLVPMCRDPLKTWTLRGPHKYRNSELSDGNCFGLFIMKTLGRDSATSKPAWSYLWGMLLSHVHSTTYRRSGVFSMDGPPDGNCPLLEIGEHRTVVII